VFGLRSSELTEAEHFNTNVTKGELIARIDAASLPNDSRQVSPDVVSAGYLVFPAPRAPPD
jgi:hypothetical protein